jgi:hypothetical protein
MLFSTAITEHNPFTGNDEGNEEMAIFLLDCSRGDHLRELAFLLQIPRVFSSTDALAVDEHPRNLKEDKTLRCNVGYERKAI